MKFVYIIRTGSIVYKRNYIKFVKSLLWSILTCISLFSSSFSCTTALCVPVWVKGIRGGVYKYVCVCVCACV